MNVSLETDKDQVRKNDIITYSLEICDIEKNSGLLVEIIPSAEVFPETNIIPDTDDYELNENGIIQIEIPPASSDIDINFSGRVVKNFEQNTTAVIVTSDNNGSTYETYTQVTLQGHSSPFVVPLICTLIFITISAFLVKRFI